jgi:hypothetical protein
MDEDETSPPSGYIIDPDTTGLFDTDYGNITIRFEYGNRLKALAALSDAIDYEWWVATTGDDYNTDKFNIASYKGSQSSVKTYAITGASANCARTSREKDVSNMVNYVHILGYGDGVNQISTSIYSASNTYSTLSADITSSSTTISLVDASDFDSSGTVRIAEEQITYTGKSGNNLTGCGRGANGTTAKAHKKSVYIEQYYTLASPESGSSVDTYGKMEYTVIDRTLINEETAELIATKYLLERMTPIIRIKVAPNEPLGDIEDLETGDLVTVTDAEAETDGDYRVVGLEYVSDYGVISLEVELSNRSLEFMEQMQKQREEAESMEKYMQGATNIYAITEYENCDNSKPLNLRFWLPSEAVAVNHVKLRFGTQKFRAYGETTTPSPGSSKVAASSTYSGSQNFTNTWKTVASFTTSSDNIEGIFINFGIEIYDYTGADPDGTVDFNYRIYDGSTYYPSSGGSNLSGGNCEFDAPVFYSPNISMFIPGNKKNTTFSFQVRESHSGVTWYANATGDYLTLSQHTHDMDFGIYEETFPAGSPQVKVEVGAEGSESEVSGSPFNATDGGTHDVDITSEVAGVGAGNWINIKFTPQSGSDHNRLRIEANAYVQIFIESE